MACGRHRPGRKRGSSSATAFKIHARMRTCTGTNMGTNMGTATDIATATATGMRMALGNAGVVGFRRRTGLSRHRHTVRKGQGKDVRASWT